MSVEALLQTLRAAAATPLIYALVGVLLAAYFLGAIPIGYLIAKLYGVDIRKRGSGNIGATNVNRELGKVPGIITLVLDIAKGILAAQLAQIFGFDTAINLAPVLGLCAIVGHCFSPFLGFRGGKGVATALGVFLVIAPLQTVVAVILFALILGASRYVSLASISAAVLVPLLIYAWEWRPENDPTLAASIAASVLIIWRHRENIQRLLTGAEHKI
jgi:acyl phosphate:glycerol-3-phosphate acyltransferase